MAANTSAIDDIVRSAYAQQIQRELAALRRDVILALGGDPDARYREIPLSAAQEAQNAEWRGRVKAAQEQLEEDITSMLDRIEDFFDVKVTQDEGGYRIDDSAPPHPQAYERILDGS